MSNLQNSSEMLKSSTGDEHKEQKVIVLSIKDMPSFKMKDLYHDGGQGGQQIFNFKPQQLLQSSSGSTIPLQVTQQSKTTANVQVQPVPKIISTTPTQFVIRTQANASKIFKSPPQQPPQQQQQFISLVVTPTGEVKVQEDAPKLITSQVTIQNTKPKVIATPALSISPQQKPFQVIQKPPAFKVFQKDVRQIAAVPLEHQKKVIIKSPPQPSAWKPKYITLPPTIGSDKPKIIASTSSSSLILPSQQIPALAPIQRKVVAVPEEMTTKTELNNEEFLNVKRIIEGDDDLNIAANGKKEKEEKITEEEEEEVKDKCSEVITSQSETLSEEQAALSSDSLLCDEQIASISPEESPNDKVVEDASSVTPTQVDTEINYKSMATESVKKTLNLDLVGPSSGSDENEKIQLTIEVEEENDSVISDDTNISMQKNTTVDNDNDDSLPLQSAEKKAPKRSRKSKNPTVNTNLGLPYKPQVANNRKKKNEKKMELELDFHDPLNKILWEDGIGGLNNCNKLFGFDDFGLVEVILKKDQKPKFNDTFEGNFKFKKILNPEDQFVCVVCSKMGTIRDFFSPECCSEACLAITKRKAFEYGEQHDSGQSSPTSESKKIMYDGEMISIQQLQNELMTQKTRKRKESVKKISVSSDLEDNFSWSEYLNSKSVPAPSELFKNSRLQQTSNPFKVGMKMEAIDPKNPNLFCVCTVEERLGHRIKLHFDGFSSVYDFWVDAGSKNIFPIEFCRSTKRQLQLPPRWPNKNFDWSEYLDAQNCVGAQRVMFPHLSIKEENCGIKIGMKLEVLKNDSWYVGTITDILGDKLLIKYDGNYEKLGYDWFDFNSPCIGPCDGHKTDEEVTTFHAPVGADNFSWNAYLKSTKSEAVPDEFFALHEPLKNEFKPGMKLEVVDKVNAQLIRPATILQINDHKIQVNYDGFHISYAYWIESNSDEIYPINYCKQTGHPIEHPAGHDQNENQVCSTAGCRGIGNGIYPERYFHEKDNECPYNVYNWKKFLEGSPCNRLDYKQNPVKKIQKVQKETNGSEKRQNRQSLLKVKREVKPEQPERAVVVEIPVIENVVEEPPPPPPPVVVHVPGQRGRKRKQPPVEPERTDSVPVAKVKIVEDFLRGYGPQLNYTFQLWQENSKVLDRVKINEDELTANPLKWSVDDVCAYLLKFCDEETSAKFYAQKVDGEALLGLCQDDLLSLMNIKMGPAIKIYNRIMHLRQKVVANFIEI